MQAKHYLLTGVAVVLSFAAGFLLANSLNRDRLDELSQARDAASAQADPKASSPDSDLSEKEISDKIKEADADPKNFGFQKGLALGLYRFAALKRDEKLLVEVERLLTRAHSLNPDDYEVLVSYANINFDLGRINSENAKVEKSRTLYKKALEKNPKDTNVLSDLGMSYMEVEPKQPSEAIKYLERAFGIDPGKEKTLAGLNIAYIALGMPEKAAKAKEDLAKINPNHPDLMPSSAPSEGGSK